ncbi:unnamed protein product [Cyprideis torosa]|uniref:Uncharacterized protein n=1 Tax=Cyprideis torosa TaxID=163714 RepID=A0A7R8WGV0_9CRUS|nr:unnamed protein product [Cyprideis torosa]CAG0893062.1 unnamed protein product [Cyprideis torosa]
MAEVDDTYLTTHFVEEEQEVPGFAASNQEDASHWEESNLADSHESDEAAASNAETLESYTENENLLDAAEGIEDDTWMDYEDSDEEYSPSAMNYSRLSQQSDLFRCNVCPRSFITKDLLVSHARTHSMERPFVCQLCGWAFAHHSDLSSHLRTIHGTEPYVRVRDDEKPRACGVCGLTFPTVGRLYAHMRLGHREEDIRASPQRTDSPEALIENQYQRLQQQQLHQIHDHEKSLPLKKRHALNGATEHLKSGESSHVGDQSTSRNKTTDNTCDICGKTICGNIWNMQRHKRTIHHLTDDQINGITENHLVEVPLKPVESTASPSTTKTASSSAPPVQKKASLSRKKGSTRPGYIRPSVGTIAERTCPVCSRVISEKRHLERHMQTHSPLKSKQIDATLSSEKKTKPNDKAKRKEGARLRILSKKGKGRILLKTKKNTKSSMAIPVAASEKPPAAAERKQYKCSKCPRIYTQTISRDNHERTIHGLEVRTTYATVGQSRRLLSQTSRCVPCDQTFDSRQSLADHKKRDPFCYRKNPNWRGYILQEEDEVEPDLQSTVSEEAKVPKNVKQQKKPLVAVSPEPPAVIRVSSRKTKANRASFVGVNLVGSGSPSDVSPTGAIPMPALKLETPPGPKRLSSRNLRQQEKPKLSSPISPPEKKPASIAERKRTPRESSKGVKRAVDILLGRTLMYDDADEEEPLVKKIKVEDGTPEEQNLQTESEEFTESIHLRPLNHCEICDEGFSTIGALAKHRQDAHGSERAVYICRECPEPVSFITPTGLTLHKNTRHQGMNIRPSLVVLATPEKEERLKTPQSTSSNKSTSSSRATTRISTGALKIKHVRRNLSFWDESDQEHKPTLSSSKKNFKRQAVQVALSTQADKPKIIRVKGGFKCDKCSLVMPLYCHIVLHYRSHTGVKCHRCDICGAEFALFLQLANHKRWTHKRMNMKTRKPIDKKSSKNERGQVSKPTKGKAGLKKPKQNVKQVALPVIEKNSNQFKSVVAIPKTRSSQKEGTRVELKETTVSEEKHKYYCTYCKKDMKNSFALSLHTRLHTGERPYVCRLCKKSFQTKGNVTMHLRNTHKTDRHDFDSIPGNTLMVWTSKNEMPSKLTRPKKKVVEKNKTAVSQTKKSVKKPLQPTIIKATDNDELEELEKEFNTSSSTSEPSSQADEVIAFMSRVRAQYVPWSSCLVCNKRFESPGALANHQKTEHEKVPPLALNAKSTVQEVPCLTNSSSNIPPLNVGDIHCTSCDRTFKNKIQLALHMKQHKTESSKQKHTEKEQSSSRRRSPSPTRTTKCINGEWISPSKHGPVFLKNASLVLTKVSSVLDLEDEEDVAEVSQESGTAPVVIELDKNLNQSQCDADISSDTPSTSTSTGGTSVSHAYVAKKTVPQAADPAPFSWLSSSNGLSAVDAIPLDATEPAKNKKKAELNKLNPAEGKKNFTCRRCKMSFSTSEGYELHHSSVHPGLSKFHCGPCNIRFISSASFLAHQAWEHGFSLRH